MPKPNLTVLVLDDDEDNVTILEAALGAAGFHVSCARSCAEAKSTLSAGPVDALVADYSLGDGNAVDLMLALGAARPTVAVLVTGYGSPEHQASARAAGFDAHLVKPIEFAHLLAVLQGALAQAAQGQPGTNPAD